MPMKKTQLKDAVRNIIRQKVTYLSIIVIALLGVTAFLGIDFASIAMLRNDSRYLNRMNFRDLEVISTQYLTEDDLEEIRKLEGVKDVEPVNQTKAKINYEDGFYPCNIVTVTKRINQPEILEGRMPEKIGELAIEKTLADASGWGIGTEIDNLEMLENTGSSFYGYSEDDNMVVTGIARHPDHTNVNTGELPYIWVSPDCYDPEQMENCCVKALVVMEKPEETDRFSGDYDALIAPLEEKIEEIAPERAEIRRDYLEKKALGEIEDVRKALAEQKDKLDKDLAWAEEIRDKIEQQEEALKERQEALAAMEYTSAEYRETAMALREDWKAHNRRKKQILTRISDIKSGYEGLAEMDSACDRMAKDAKEMQAGKWIILNHRGNVGYVQALTDSGNLKNLEKTFSLMFILLGALVIYAAISKMVDEQRSLVGASRALGLFRGEIFAKYILFGTSASLIGTLAGILLAALWLEPFILNGYSDFYIFDTEIYVNPVSTLLVLTFSLLLSLAAVWIAARRLLRLPAVALMQPPVPAGRKKAGSGKKPLLSLYSRLILLNMRSDIRRVLVTIVSVAGCCALVVIGFSLKYAVSGSLEKQYPGISDYDARLRTDFLAVETEGQIQDMGLEGIPLMDTMMTYRVTDLQAGQLYCGDIEKISGYFHMRDWRTGELFTGAEDGVLIPRRIAEMYDLEVGSEFEMSCGGYMTAIVRVAGIYENFIGAPIVMTPDYYLEKFQANNTEENTIFLRLGGRDPAELEKRMRSEIFAVEDLITVEEEQEDYRSTTSVINAIVVLLIVMAAVMAAFVLLNLTNIYILQKKRELTIMRVNGFTVREVIGYVIRETIVTMVLGILLGLAEGSRIAYRIIRAMEQPVIQFDRNLNPLAWIWAVLITVFFTVIVNRIALRRVRDLKLTDALL